MNKAAPRDYFHEAARGSSGTRFVVEKFGRNAAVGTTFVPVAAGGIYRTVQPAAATALRIAAGGSANDTADGSGARAVALQGLDASGNLVTEVVATAGASASAATTNTFIRLFRAWVSSSGTYATQSAGSHTAAITIQNAAGGTTWATIGATGFPKGQTEIGAYSVPSGYRAFIKEFFLSSDSTKTTDFILFTRGSILKAAAPYDAMRARFVGQTTGQNTSVTFRSGLGPFDGPCDIGFLAKVNVGTAQVTIDFEIIVEKIDG